MAPSPPEEDKGGKADEHKLGCGIFMILAGLFYLAESLGWINGGSWVLSALLIAWGVSYVYHAVRNR
jgi:hypothetical protein